MNLAAEFVGGIRHVASRNRVRWRSQRLGPARRVELRANAPADPAPRPRESRPSFTRGVCSPIPRPGGCYHSNPSSSARDGRIVGIEAGYVTRDGAHVIDETNRFVLPGFADCHVHLTSELGPNQLLEEVHATVADAAIRGADNARKTVMAGFTTVADVGAPNDAIFALRRGIAEGRIPGPRIIASGSIVTPDGGHGDVNGYAPISWTRCAIPPLAPALTIAGAPCATNSGRREPHQDHRHRRRAFEHGRRRRPAIHRRRNERDRRSGARDRPACNAHAHGADGINAALRAGVDSIEHGTYSDAESFRLLHQGNRYLVPTMMAGWWVTRLAEQGGTLTPAQTAKARMVGPALQAMVRRAHAAHVRIAFGTDTGVSPHGMNAQ